MSSNATLFGLLGFALVLGGIGGYAGYTVGYSRAHLEAQVQIAEKDKQIADLSSRPAPRPEGGEKAGDKQEKPEFEPTTMTAEELSVLVPSLGGLSGEAQSKATYILNNVVGACMPCFDQQYSIGKCLERAPKLLDKTMCSDMQNLGERAVRLAKAGKSPDEIRAAVEFSQPWLNVDTSGRPSKGPADAPVTIVEYSDFQCPYCKKAQPNIKEVSAKYGNKVRWVFMNQPLAMHQMARPAALAALAADKQGKFWEYHDALFASEGIDEAKLVQIARDIGLNVGKWEADRKSTEVDQMVADDVRVAEKWKISSTPTFLVNGYKIKGAMPPEFFARIIDAELEDPR